MIVKFEVQNCNFFSGSSINFIHINVGLLFNESLNIVANSISYLSKMSVLRFFFLLFLLCNFNLSAQSGFLLPSNKKQVTVPFKLINNLIFIPVEVNGYPMTFLLDSGVEETVLFSLEEQEHVQFFNVEKIKLRGLGKQESIEALKSSYNQLSIAKHLKDDAHTILIILDQDINFSSTVGIPVNGIIGSHFFKNHLIYIDYISKKIHIKSHDHRRFKRKLENYKPIAMPIEGNKPYIQGGFLTDQLFSDAKFLVDTGNSYPVWIFEHLVHGLKVPEPNFQDFLGKGFSGDVFGKQARIESISFNEFTFKRPITAFPDSISLMSVKLVENRSGSIGGGILKRLHLVFDYKNQMMYARKNSNFNEPFKYNASGLEVYQIGMQWVQEKISLNTGIVKVSQESHYNNKKTDFLYKFFLKPVYSIGVVRNDSPAQKAGLKVDDLLIEINNKKVNEMSLEDINQVLRSDAGKKISLKIERNQVIYNFSFTIQKTL